VGILLTLFGPYTTISDTADPYKLKKLYGAVPLRAKGEIILWQSAEILDFLAFF